MRELWQLSSATGLVLSTCLSWSRTMKASPRHSMSVIDMRTGRFVVNVKVSQDSPLSSQSNDNHPALTTDSDCVVRLEDGTSDSFGAVVARAGETNPKVQLATTS